MKTSPTSRPWLLSTLIAFLTILVIAPATAQAQVNDEGAGKFPFPLVNPAEEFRGKSFEEWNRLWVDWFFRTRIGGEVLPDTIDGVRLLPASFDLGLTEFDPITVAHGTAFVYSPFGNGGPVELLEDPAILELIDQILETSSIRIELNGNVLVDGSPNDVEEFGFSLLFDPPLVGEFGFVFGLGQLYMPLPVGEHTLVTEVDIPAGGAAFTYIHHITVLPLAQNFRAIGTGAQEVPPAATAATSVANLTVLNVFGHEMLFTSRIDQRLSSRFLAAHIHLAPVGVNGPIVIPYDPPLFEFLGFAVSVDTHTSADLVGPLAGMTLHDLVREIQAGNTYVNVHTANFPGGETRGQIE